jgi:hypothetical protein
VCVCVSECIGEWVSKCTVNEVMTDSHCTHAGP